MIGKSSCFNLAYRILLCLVFILPLFFGWQIKETRAADKIYIDQDATGGLNNGSSWENAYLYLQDALDETNADGTTDYEIWVAEGVYYPDEDSVDNDLDTFLEHTPGDRNEAFQILYDNVQIYGGFAGTEGRRSQRDWVSNLTILSGDIDKNDAHDIGVDWSEIDRLNSFHVFIVDGSTFETITNDTVLDGFVITAGGAYDTGLTGYEGTGGGLVCFAISGDCSPTLQNLRVQGNDATGLGGGLSVVTDVDGSSSLHIIQSYFIGNRGDEGGGIGMVFLNPTPADWSYPVLVNLKFLNNYAINSGGGLAVTSDTGKSQPAVANVEFESNEADSRGGGLFLHAVNSPAVNNITLSNLTVVNNTASLGGGIQSRQYLGGSLYVNIENSILWGNTASTDGDSVYNEMMGPDIDHSDVQGCGGSGSWNFNCGNDDGGNLDVNPLFENPGSGDFRLQDSSTLIDAGDHTLLPHDYTDLDEDGDTIEALPLDLIKNSRVENNNVDMGACERWVYTGDKVGLYDPATSRWFLKPENVGGGAGVTKFYYGPAGGGRIPISGDWDGDGTDTVGFYDPATSRWFLRQDTLDGGNVVFKFYYGPAGGGRLPIVGDWDGDGTDTVGLYDPATSRWFLKPANVDGGAGVIKFYYGPAGGGRLPITGDWDGDGADTVGLYDPVKSRWFLKPDNLDGSAGVIKFYYGPAGGGRLPIAGDWDVDGADTTGMYDPSNSRWFLKPDNLDGGAGVIKFYYGPAGGGRLPIAGTW